VRDGKCAPLNRCAYEVRCAVLIRSPIECIIGRARAAPTNMGDRFRHEPIGAEWQRGGGQEEFRSARRRRRWIVREQFGDDPLKESPSACKRAAKDHPVAERCRGWARPETAWEGGADALCLSARCRHCNSTGGATHIDAEPGIGETRANNGGEPVIHPRGD
jgi:hypothetical protein